MKKIVIFAFRGDVMCFIHVLLNALDMKAKGYDVKLVIEGEATKVIPEMAAASHPLNQIYQKIKSQGLIDGVCRACSAKMNVTAQVEAEGLAFLDDMNGHPSMARYLNNGFELITF